MRRPRTLAVLLAMIFATALFGYAKAAEGQPEGFVHVEEVIPNIRVELRYLTDNNFIGRPVDGYIKSRCMLTKEATCALKKVQDKLNRFGLGLKIYDAYRPQRAVSHFVRWAKDVDDIKMKSAYYPHVKKAELFRKGYIAEKSSHSRGSTVDVTIVPIKESEGDRELDMGTGFDLFDPKSWPDNPTMNPDQRAHRLLLRTLMIEHGFQPYPKEWWHFTLEREPYPDTYFDFPVQ
jgi:D-alanyl-D-alanine dipeptidase